MSDFKANWPDVRIEDIFYATGNSSTTLWRWIALHKARWYKRATGRLRNLPVDFALSESYNHFCDRHGHEPDWMRHLSPDMRSDIRHRWITSDNFDPLWIFWYQRGLGFSFGIWTDGFVHDIAIAFNLFRLGCVRQLGFLHDPVVNDLTADVGMAENFHHSRLAHVAKVGAVAGLIARQIKLPPKLTRIVIAAGLTHDKLTPAGGDSVKPIDPAGLDEDAHYHEIFENNPYWEQVSQRHGLDADLLIRTVNGQGLLGQILDLADKTTYVAHDAEAYLKWNHPKKFGITPPPGFMEIAELYRKLRQTSCRLWDCVEIVAGQLVITNPKRLAGFLKLRALMFKYLYFNPRARYREQMLALLILEPLYHEGHLTREMLIRMTDWELWGWMTDFTGCEIREQLSYSNKAPMVEAFATEEEALARLRVLHTDDQTLLFMLETFPEPSRKAVQMLVRDEAGMVRPFTEACPEEAKEILAIGRDPAPVKLYILDRHKMHGVLPEHLVAKLYARQRERFGLE